MTKRTFFKRAMAMVACVALAPEIAFGVRLRMAEASKHEPEVQCADHNNRMATWYDTKRDVFYAFRDGKWVESGFAGQD